jgi:tetratricopeptide (TPR) repeat protein
MSCWEKLVEMKQIPLLLLLALPALAQPVTPGLKPRTVPNMTAESADQREAKFLFEEARRLHREGEVARAVDLYQKALAKDPARLEYRPYLAQALESQSQHEEALEQYDLYLQQEPRDSRIQRERLLPLISLQRWEDLDREFQALDSSHAQDADYLQYKGLSLLRRNRAAEAQPLLALALQLQPQREDIRLNLASAQLQSGNAAAALKTLEPLPEEKLLRGLAFYSLGDIAKAEQSWRGQQNVDAGVNLASSLAERGQDREALLLAAEMLDRDPQHQSGKLLYARLLNRAERYEEAWATLRPLLEPNAFQGRRGYFLELVGWTLLGLQRDDESLQYLSEAARLGQQGAALQHNLALVLARLGRTPEALEHELKAVELAPNQAPAWYHLGMLYERRAQPRQALQAYQRFLQLAPEAPAGLRQRMKALETR